MFNSPRGVQPYLTTSANGLGSSYVEEGPLGSSSYDNLDPWSAAPSPSPPPTSAAPPSIFNSVIADATVPSIYGKAYAAVDPTNSGETSVNALSRVLGTSGLPAATIDRIVNLVSNRPRVSKLEFFVSLALVALAQSGKDVSIEQVAALSSQNTLPEPDLDLGALPPSSSTIPFTPDPQYRFGHASAPRPSAPPYSSDDPWSTTRSPNAFDAPQGYMITGAPSILSGSGMPKDWWKKQETVHITILGQQGFILNRYLVYEVASDRGAPVSRRYSHFVFLWDCLIRRYPFRLLPVLPPKRIGPDEQFLEQRRRGLARFLNFIVNHPIIKEDALLGVFLTDPSFDEWRKRTSISLDEESVSKRIDRAEEMSIPSDLEEKFLIVRRKINPLIEQWQRICALGDRIMKRHEAAAADLSRLTNVMKALVEDNDHCWRGEICELCDGVREGIRRVAFHTQRHSDLVEERTSALLHSTLEALKSQRDLYIAMRDLFVRHDRLSIDQVERLKKRVEMTSMKLEGVRQAPNSEGREEEAERLGGLIQKDQATIAAQLHRRVFIRASMWHELRVVLHNRENALLSEAVKAFAREEHESSQSISLNWMSLVEAVDNMPYE